MIQGAVQVPCYETRLGGWDGDLYNGALLETSFDGGAWRLEAQLMISLHFSLSILKQKVSEVESFFKLCYSQPVYHGSTSSMAVLSMTDLMQEIVETASSMMLNCQVMALGSTQEGNNANIVNNSLMSANQEAHTMQKTDVGLAHQFNVNGVDKVISQGLLDGDSFYDWYAYDTTYNNSTGVDTSRTTATTTTTVGGLDERNGSQVMSKNNKEWEVSPEAAYDVVELDAEDLLARYTHYCQVCGRGFKREANLRMHMRAHGDEYKSSLIGNPLKKTSYEENKTTTKPPRKYYSCPHKGCKWNKNHLKFQPLKSIVCVRNHYKRSHCPKMFVCKRCNTKEFSVLSDLKTHEKHCGDIKWYCSCGTSFSKKDKLMDHVALFFGHTPLIYP